MLFHVTVAHRQTMKHQTRLAVVAAASVGLAATPLMQIVQSCSVLYTLWTAAQCFCLVLAGSNIGAVLCMQLCGRTNVVCKRHETFHLCAYISVLTLDQIIAASTAKSRSSSSINSLQLCAHSLISLQQHEQQAQEQVDNAV